VLVLLVASATGLPQPLLPLQILWLNMVTDTFPALALAVEPAEPDLMRRPPRDPQEAILSRPFLARIAFYAVLIAAATLAAFVVALRAGDATRAGTVAFMTLALAQALHLGNARSTAAVLHPRHALSNPWALGSVALVVALQALAMHLPGLARVLRVLPLNTSDWALVLVAAAVPAVVGQAIKLVRTRPSS
jgi:Ca2+-transporting ATPase